MAAVGLVFPLERLLSKPFGQQIFPKLLMNFEYLSWQHHAP
jgi:hypothetical protein